MESPEIEYHSNQDWITQDKLSQTQEVIKHLFLQENQHPLVLD